MYRNLYDDRSVKILSPEEYGVEKNQIQNAHTISIAYLTHEKYNTSMQNKLINDAQKGIIYYIYINNGKQEFEINSKSKRGGLFILNEFNIEIKNKYLHDIHNNTQRFGPIYFTLRGQSDITIEFMQYKERYAKVGKEWDKAKIEYNNSNVAFDEWQWDDHDEEHIELIKNYLNGYDHQVNNETFSLLRIIKSFQENRVIEKDDNENIMIWLCGGYFRKSFRTVEQITQYGVRLRQWIDDREISLDRRIVATIASKAMVAEYKESDNIRLYLPEQWIYNIAKNNVTRSINDYLILYDKLERDIIQTCRFYHSQKHVCSEGDILYYAKILCIIMTRCDTRYDSGTSEVVISVKPYNAIFIMNILIVELDPFSLMAICGWTYKKEWNEDFIYCTKANQHNVDDCFLCCAQLSMTFLDFKITSRQFMSIKLKGCFMEANKQVDCGRQVYTHKIILQLLSALFKFDYVGKIEGIIGRKIKYEVIAGTEHERMSMVISSGS